MKINKFLPVAALMAAGTINLLPAKAGNVRLINPQSFGTSEHVHLALTVTHLGVPIIDGSASGISECKPTRNSVTFGFYSPAHNLMVLCTGNGSFEQIKETFVHETIHMVQDCRAGLANSALRDQNGKFTEWQYARLSHKHKQNIHSLYSGKDQVYEVEARKLDHSPLIAWKYLVKHCR